MCTGQPARTLQWRANAAYRADSLDTTRGSVHANPAPAGDAVLIATVDVATPPRPVGPVRTAVPPLRPESAATIADTGASSTHE